MRTARTVLGDVPTAELGVCNSHDHLFFRTPMLPGQELDDTAAAVAEASRFRELGGSTIVQWTPFGLGRRAADLVEVSRASGVHVIAATGLHQGVHYPQAVRDLTEDALAELFVGELTQGMHADDDPNGPVTPVLAGMIKVAGAFHGIDAHARRTMVAAAGAHHRTGAPIGVHLELGTAAGAVVALLCDELQVPVDRVVIGHLNRSPDLRPLRALAETGVFLAFDGPSRANHATDWRLFDLLTDLATRGHSGQLLLGGDTTTAAARAATGGGPGMPFLLTSIRPGLAAELGDEITGALFVDNPGRAFGVDRP